MALRELTSKHRADLEELTGLASNDLAIIWQTFGNAGDTLAGLMAVLPDLVAVYGSAAATLGADWYEEMREAAEVSGSFTAVTSDVPGTDRSQALAGWGSSLVGEGGLTAALVQVTGGLQRIIANADRRSVSMSSVADDKATGWQRMGHGNCGFCAILIGRGSVYRESTASFASHDHCKCLAVPAFKGVARLVDPYTPSVRQASDADRARVRAYMQANP